MTSEEFVETLATLCDPSDGFYPRMPMSRRMACLWRDTLLPYPIGRFQSAILTYVSHNPIHPPSLADVEKLMKPRGLIL